MWLLDTSFPGNEKIEMTLASAGLWTILFGIACLGVCSPSLAQKNLWDIRNRLVSAVHGTLAYWLSIYCLSFWRDFGQYNTFLENALISITLGYFIYDTVCMLVLSVYDSFIMVHHVSVIIGLSTALVTDMGGAEISWGYFITEGSNAFLHAKEITRALGLKDTQLYLFVEMGFFATYFFGRFAVGVPGVYMIVTSNQTPLLVRSVAFLLEVQSFQWGYRMTKIIRKRRSEAEERKKKGIVMNWLTPMKAS